MCLNFGVICTNCFISKLCKTQIGVFKMIPLPIGQFEWLVGAMCLIPIIWFLIAILLCIWVYRDAETRGMNGVLWLIVVLIAGIIGLIVYLVVRKEKPTAPAPAPVTRICPQCGRVIPPEVKFCPHCGKELG